jgi:hypothetical protein
MCVSQVVGDSRIFWAISMRVSEIINSFLKLALVILGNPFLYFGIYRFSKSSGGHNKKKQGGD